MALQLTINAVDRTSLLELDTLRVEQVAGALSATCAFTLLDADANVTISAKEEVLVEETVSGMVYFKGRIAGVSYQRFGTDGRHIEIDCQDFNILADEYVIYDLEEFGAAQDDVIIDTLFDKYLPAVDSETHVDHLFAFAEIDFENITLADALNEICRMSQGKWYIDADKALHYFDAEADTAPWGLSDTPDDVNTFSYLSEPVKGEDATQVVTRVYVAGVDVTILSIDAAAEAALGAQFAAIVRDNTLVGVDEVTDRGEAILEKYSMPLVTYTVKVAKEGLKAGMDIGFKCGLYDVDTTFTIRGLGITWPQGVAEYELEIGDVPISAAGTAQGNQDLVDQAQLPIVSPRLPVASMGWGHDLVFSATDHNTVEWTLGELTTSAGTVYSIVAGNTGNMAADTITYIYLDLDTSETVLQTVVDAMGTAVGSKIILVAVAAPVAAGKDAIFQVFGGKGIGVMIMADNIAANQIIANHIGSNTIITGSANIDTGVINNLHWSSAYADRLAINKINLGGKSFFADDGLFLLGPHCLITSTSWRTMRLQEATLSGAFQRVAGKWLGTKALLVEPAGLNYCTAPRMIDADSNGRADNWTLFETCDGSPTLTVGAHPIEIRGWAQRVQYTGQAFDVSNHIIVYHDTPAASFAPGESVTLTMDVKTDFEGVTYQIEIEAYNNLGAWIAEVTYAPSLSTSLERIELTYPSLPATTDHVRVSIHVDNISNGDTVDVYFGAVNVEKSKCATSFICGALPWCAWSGTADNSTSTRVKTTVNLDDHVGLLEGNSIASHVAVVQAPYDHDADWPTVYAYVLSFAKAGDNNNEVYLMYYADAHRFYVYINGAFRIAGTVTAFNKGDWLQIALTYDFAGNAYLYLNGVQIGSADISALAAPTGLTDWCLASDYGEIGQSGWAVAEYAVYDDVLTLTEINEGYQLNRPTIDTLPQDVPGIYILDGRFRIQSSYTGNRIEITADEIAGYGSAGDWQFRIRASDGSAECGAGAVKLHGDGIDVDMGGDLKNRISFMHSGTERGYIWPKAYVTAALLDIRAGLPSANTHVARVVLEAVPFTGTGDKTRIVITSCNNTVEGNIRADVDGSMIFGVYDYGIRLTTDKHLTFHDEFYYLYRSGSDIYWKPGGGAAVKLN